MNVALVIVIIIIILVIVGIGAYFAFGQKVPQNKNMATTSKPSQTISTEIPSSQSIVDQAIAAENTNDERVAKLEEERAKEQKKLDIENAKRRELARKRGEERRRKMIMEAKKRHAAITKKMQKEKEAERKAEQKIKERQDAERRKKFNELLKNFKVLKDFMTKRTFTDGTKSYKFKFSKDVRGKLTMVIEKGGVIKAPELRYIYRNNSIKLPNGVIYKSGNTLVLQNKSNIIKLTVKK